MRPIEVELNLCMELLALEEQAGNPDPEYVRELTERQNTALLESLLA